MYKIKRQTEGDYLKNLTGTEVSKRSDQLVHMTVPGMQVTHYNKRISASPEMFSPGANPIIDWTPGASNDPQRIQRAWLQFRVINNNPTASIIVYDPWMFITLMGLKINNVELRQEQFTADEIQIYRQTFKAMNDPRSWISEDRRMLNVDSPEDGIEILPTEQHIFKLDLFSVFPGLQDMLINSQDKTWNITKLRIEPQFCSANNLVHIKRHFGTNSGGNNPMANISFNNFGFHTNNTLAFPVLQQSLQPLLWIPRVYSQSAVMDATVLTNTVRFKLSDFATKKFNRLLVCCSPNDPATFNTAPGLYRSGNKWVSFSLSWPTINTNATLDLLTNTSDPVDNQSRTDDRYAWHVDSFADNYGQRYTYDKLAGDENYMHHMLGLVGTSISLNNVETAEGMMVHGGVESRTLDADLTVQPVQAMWDSTRVTVFAIHDLFATESNWSA